MVAPLLVSLTVVAISAWLTWLPFFSNVGLPGLRQAVGYAGLSLVQRLLASAQAIFLWPIWSLAQLLQFGHADGLPPLQVDAHLLSPRTLFAYDVTQYLLIAQGIVCYLALIVATIRVIVRKRRPADIVPAESRSTAGILGLLFIFVLASYALAPLMGGAAWVQGQRLDEAAQFVPVLMMVWFLLPPLLDLPARVKRAALMLTLGISVTFGLVSALTGIAVIRSNLLYQGRQLPTDVPLVDKLAAVRFIARDWTLQSSSLDVPVAYALGQRGNDWITTFGEHYLQWYPAPYTLGRTYDFLLLREYGLYNMQEGIQARSLEGNRYLITYTFVAAPSGEGYRNYRFGRLRVTIMPQNP